MRKMTLSKQRQKKARERRVAQEKIQLADRRRYALAFPRFVLKTNNAPQQFVDLVWQTIKKIDFRDRKVFRPAETGFLKLAKKKPGEVFSALVAGAKVGNPFAVHFSSFVGQAVFDLIPGDQLRQWIPFHDVQFLPVGNEIVVTFRSLEQTRGPGGTVYFSRHRPVLEIDGQEKVVAWSRHAITRTCERLAPRWDRYLGLGDVFAFFDKCVHFERADLHGGQLGFSFYDVCAPGYFSELYAENVLGGLGTKPSYYRVGYCPAVVEGEFVKATTLLYPGFRSTPEFGAVLKAPITGPERRRLIEEAGRQSRRTWSRPATLAS